MSQQGYRQASVRAVTGTANSYEGDWHALFTLAGIPQGDYDGRLLQWINLVMSKAYTNLPEAMQAFAVGQGAANWSSMGTFAASSWTPADLGASLLGWWDAEDSSTLTLSGAAVTTWLDKVAGYSATQSTGSAKPTYSATSFNGRPGITFDGADDTLTVTPSPFPIGANACELWGLWDQQALVADATGRCSISYGGATATTQRRQQRGVGGTNLANTLVGNGTVAVQANATGDFSGYHVARSIIGGTSSQTSLDGSVSAAAAVTPATTNNRVRLGASSNTAAGTFWQGQANSILVTATLTEPEAAQLLVYLKARGGIP